MRSEEFFLILFENWEKYIYSLIVSLIVIYPILKKYFRSIIDPLFFAFLGVIFANAVPIFLFFTNNIEEKYFFYFCFSELIFWIGFLSYKDKNYFLCNDYNRDVYTYILFVISASIIIILQLYYYARQGIPIFFESRIDKYSGATSGMGIIERLTYVLTPFCIIYSFSHLFDKVNLKKKFLSRLFLIFILLTYILSGSKSAFLGLLGPLFFYTYYLKQIKIPLNKLLLLFLFIILSAAIVLYLNGKTGIDICIALLYRFVMYGDIYYEAYGYDIVDSVVIHHPFKDLFVGLLGPFRILDYSIDIDSSPSIQIHRMIYPELADQLKGPNNRLPVLSYCLFGYWGILLSFILGWLTSLFMFGLTKYIKRDVLGISIYYAFFSSAITFITDPILAMSNIASFIFGLVFILLIYSSIINNIR